MGYYTVILKDTRSDRTKTFKGVRAVSKFDAVEQVFGDSTVNKHWVCELVHLSKYRKNHLPADKRWSTSRSRHETFEQNRKIWAVLARRRGRYHNPPRGALFTLQYHVLMDGFHNSWADMSSFVEDKIVSPVKELFDALREATADLEERNNAAVSDHQ